MFFSIPSLLPTVQERLLNSISIVLSRTPYPQARLVGVASHVNVVNNQQVLNVNRSTLIQLAFTTLARFNFKVCYNLPISLHF